MKDANRPSGLRALVGVVLAAVYVAACSIVGRPDRPDDVYAFSHKKHVVEEGIDCVVCHKTDGDAELPTMAEPGLCLLCHKDMDAEKPQSRRIHNLFVNDVYQATRAARLDEEIVFDHSGHLAAGIDCASCHGDMRENVRISEANEVTMEECMDCHGEQSMDQSCSVCHSVVDTNWAPPNHAHEWDREHGLVVRANVDVAAQRCDLCHTESTCVQCHRVTPPRNHDNTWRLRGHPIVAGLDRQNCATCHRDDFCSRCHQEVRPLSHRGSFGSPRNNHCAGCHFPLREEGCVTCHKSAPSHQMATPLPPDHNTAMNCRLCHGAGVPLRHFDDGSNCLLCHR